MCVCVCVRVVGLLSAFFSSIIWCPYLPRHLELPFTVDQLFGHSKYFMLYKTKMFQNFNVHTEFCEGQFSLEINILSWIL